MDRFDRIVTHETWSILPGLVAGLTAWHAPDRPPRHGDRWPVDAGTVAEDAPLVAVDVPTRRLRPHVH